MSTEEIPENKSARIEFKNPEVVDLEAYKANDVNKREYYEALHTLRNILGSDTNHLVGRWLVAVEEAHCNGNVEEAIELIEQLLSGYADGELSVEIE